jgi:two-component system response regulator YesN
VNQCKTLVEAEESLIGIVRALSAMEEGSSHIREALRFIDTNLGDHNLSLTVIADHLQLNASYLSTLFKENTSHTVVNYITEKRMVQAKLLLSDRSAKTQNVAQMVGYSDTAWFIKRFKQAFGMTPNAYKEKVCR